MIDQEPFDPAPNIGNLVNSGGVGFHAGDQPHDFCFFLIGAIDKLIEDETHKGAAKQFIVAALRPGACHAVASLRGILPSGLSIRPGPDVNMPGVRPVKMAGLYRLLAVVIERAFSVGPVLRFCFRFKSGKIFFR
jgi:hypothetical protein